MAAPNVTAAALLAANEAFYDAFDGGDLVAMSELWANEHPVACLHPGAAPVLGREDVIESWRQVLNATSRPAIQCLDPNPLVLDSIGLVICTEALAGGHLIATNTFVLENGVWRIVHHQAGPLNAAPAPRKRPESRLH